jgi:hypothetical protein
VTLAGGVDTDRKVTQDRMRAVIHTHRFLLLDETKERAV